MGSEKQLTIQEVVDAEGSEIAIDWVLLTDGTSLWSNGEVGRGIPCTLLTLSYVSDSGKHGELRVRYDTRRWRPEDGLIYTDEGFLQSLRKKLANIEIAGWIDYSEQGMQSDDEVSFDVDDAFIRDFIRVSRILAR